MNKFIFVSLIIISLCSCESGQDRSERIRREEREKVEYEQQQEAYAKEEAARLEAERLEQERGEKERQLQEELRKRYLNNSLTTGSTPYSEYYGGNSSCTDYGCSGVVVRTSNSDVIVTIKRNNKVVRHAYIQSGDSYSFSFPNGDYQVFFYYGKGWNPEKLMKNGTMLGGFIEDESFGKDDIQSLHNSKLTYELILQKNGNFSTRPSDSEEAL